MPCLDNRDDARNELQKSRDRERCEIITEERLMKEFYEQRCDKLTDMLCRTLAILEGCDSGHSYRSYINDDFSDEGMQPDIHEWWTIHKRLDRGGK